MIATSGAPRHDAAAADLAAAVLDAARGRTIGVVESLTGGLVTAALVAIPGASAVLRGGVVAYATDLKAGLLGVDAGLLAQRGAVDPDVALSMADGVARVTGSTIGLATTGVAGPDSQDGRAPGTVHVAVVAPDVRRVRSLDLPGDRADVRSGAVEAVLALALEVLREQSAAAAR